jgi:hypothetical protein
VLDEHSLVARIPMPAGAQDLDWDGQRLLVTFEGGHRKYRDRWRRAGAGIESRALALRLPRGLP